MNPTLGRIIRSFKAASTRLIRHRGLADFGWQRNYYEHVIRDEESLNMVALYIEANPHLWLLDRENPAFDPQSHPAVRRRLAEHHALTDEQMDFVLNYDMRWAVRPQLDAGTD